MSLHPTASLLSVAAAITFLVSPVAAQPANGITREVYANIGGSSIPDLTNNPAFPNFPSIEAVLTNSMDCPVDFMENYGTRLRALVVPPTTGAYTFWVASDDQSVLYLSTDSTPANKILRHPLDPRPTSCSAGPAARSACASAGCPIARAVTGTTSSPTSSPSIARTSTAPASGPIWALPSHRAST